MPKDEPAYMLVARGDVRLERPSSPAVVRSLLERIERLEQEQASQSWGSPDFQ